MIWNVSVGLQVTIDYDDIEAESREEAEDIAKERVLEDIEYNNCNCDHSSPLIYCAYTEEEEE